jgi:hypothetical protein
VSGAIGEFNAYDMVVLGAGLEESSHGDHQNTKDIIDGSTADFYGYIDATLSTSAIEAKVDKWKVMGGTTKKAAGIFFDQFGFDFGLTRSQQNTIVDYVHSVGLPVFVNAWNPDDVFKKSQGNNAHLTAGDWYLAESHYVINGGWQSTSEWETKSDKMSTYMGTWNVEMACVTTTTTVVGFSQDKWDNAYYAHSVYGFQASGWGEPGFSASDALLPWRTRLAINGTEFTGSLTKNNGVFERQTNVGIHLDTSAHTISSLLD